MGTRLYGIAAAQNVDNVGETLIIEGMDISHLNVIKDEHAHDDFFHIVGTIQKAKKIFSEKDCSDPKELRCWQHAKVPFVYVEGELADDTEHPNAKASAAILKFSKRPDVNLDVGFSIDGAVLDQEDKTITKTLALRASLTVKPCNPKCVTFLENDLAKSDMVMPIPANVLELLDARQAEKSFNDVKDKTLQVLVKLHNLKKSLEDYKRAFTDIRCQRCGEGQRFFKGRSDIPNRCNKCNLPYSMSALWKALNK